MDRFDRILFISELYYPEETSTGFFVTGVAEGLAEEHSNDALHIAVLCSQPSYRQRGQAAACEEIHKGVHIRRLAAPRGDKNRLLGRLWNFLSLTVRMSWAMLIQINRGDRVVVLTNPPSLPLMALLGCKVKGAKPILWVQDVYPDVLVPVGFLTERSLLYRLLNVVQCCVLRRMTQVIVLGRDMQQRMEGKLANRPIPISIIPNWGETDAIGPKLRDDNTLRRKLGLEDKFIIQMSGNLGRTHGLEDMVVLALRLREDKRLHFLVFGWGAGRRWLEEMIECERLRNITLLDPCPKEELGTYLTCCDLFFLPFKPGMEGISVPSRLYNVMAAGNAILAVAGQQSELAQVVEEEAIGWVSEPRNIASMEAAIRAAMTNPEQLAEMRRRARAAAEAKYTRQHVIAQFAELLLCPTAAGK